MIGAEPEPRGRICHYCRCPLTRRGTDNPRSYTKDHVIPKSRGGSNRASNKVPCCRKCNAEKGNFTEKEYRAWMAAGRPDRKAFRLTLPEFHPPREEPRRSKLKEKYVDPGSWYLRSYRGEA